MIVTRHFGLSGDQYVDHINGNRLDNRKQNLRKCTFKQNLRNRGKVITASSKTRHKGIRKIRGRWFARIKVDGAEYALGGFATENEAALAYNRAAVQHFGEFANLNSAA